MDVMTAAFNLVHDHPGGAEALAQRMGKAGSTLSHEVSPQHPHAKLGLVDAVKATLITGNLAILNAFAAECGCIAVPVESGVVTDADTLQALAKLAREFGDVVSEVSGAMSDGGVSANELARVEREAGELLQSLQGVLLVLRRAHRDGTAPAVLRRAA